MFDSIKAWLASGDAKAKLVVVGVMVAIPVVVGILATGDISEAVARRGR